MLKKHYYFLILVAIILFGLFGVIKNRRATSAWVYSVKFDGTIQTIHHLKTDKGTYIEVSNRWYIISYDRKFEEQDLIGYKIRKNIGEEGVWFETIKNTGEFDFQWSVGGIVTNQAKLSILRKLKIDSL